MSNEEIEFVLGNIDEMLKKLMELGRTQKKMIEMQDEEIKELKKRMNQLDLQNKYG